MKNFKFIKENLENQHKQSEISKKKDVNLQSNSSLYFQIGLILCLLASYGLFEMNFQTRLTRVPIDPPIEEDLWTITTITPEPDASEPRPIEKKVAMLADKPPIVKPNDFIIPTPVEIITPDIATPQPTITIKNSTTEAIPVPEPPSIWNMKDVERVPIFPGCESASNNTERLACMSDKLTKLIQRRFNTDLAQDLGLQGIQKIQVQFKIDDEGRVTDIKTRSPYPQLEDEAERVVNKIPIMTPGMQRNTPVSVLYYLPIVFQVQ